MLFQRLLTVLIAAPFLIGAIICPVTAVFKAVVIFCIGVGLVEFYSIAGFEKKDRFFAVILGLVHALFLLFYPAAEDLFLLEGTLLVISIFLFHCFSPSVVSGVAFRIGFTLLGCLYVATFGAFVALTRTLADGIFWVFVLLAMTWLNDTAAYFFGHRYGRRKLAPLISPGKTLEGFLGGFLGSAAGFLLFWLLFGRPASMVDGLWLTLLVGVVGPVGDLSESLIKRSFGIKDSGNIIPGHGGMLDRIDALLFTAPVVYFYLTL